MIATRFTIIEFQQNKHRRHSPVRVLRELQRRVVHGQTVSIVVCCSGIIVLWNITACVASAAVRIRDCSFGNAMSLALILGWYLLSSLNRRRFHNVASLFVSVPRALHVILLGVLLKLLRVQPPLRSRARRSLLVLPRAARCARLTLAFRSLSRNFGSTPICKS